MTNTQQNTLEEEAFILAHSLRAVHQGGKAWWHPCGHIASILGNQKEIVTPTFRVVLAPSIDLI